MPAETRCQMTDPILVQYIGFRVKAEFVTFVAQILREAAVFLVVGYDPVE